MPHTLEIQNTVLDLTLITDQEINDDTPAFRDLYEYLVAWAKVADLKSVSMIQDGVDPLLYAWRAENNSLVVYDSTILFSDAVDLNPMVTISLPIAWPYTSIAERAEAIFQLLKMRVEFGIVSLTVDFL
jgi:hypothetical protein